MAIPARAGAAAGALGWITVCAVFLLMTLGNVVSSTGSGLACPDWPLCHGRLLPPLQWNVLIEWAHRTAAALTAVLLIATVVTAVRRAAGRPARRIGIALLVLLGVQILLGGLTVLLRLPHLLSTLHLVTALLILGGLLVLIRHTTPGRGAPERVPPSLARLARAGLLVLLAQLALGGYVRHSGAGLACPDFPLCSGGVFPGHWLAIVHWTHRWLGVVLLGLFLHVAIAGRRTRLRALTSAVGALAVVQVALGIAAVLLRLDPPVRAAHAAAGYLLWALMVWLSIRAAESRGATRAVGERRARAEVAGAV